jgi:sulfatase modifying factor 1
MLLKRWISKWSTAYVFLAVTASAAALELEWVTVGDPGNPPDKTGFGAVAREFQIGKYEVTVGQYAAFLNAVAAADPNGLWNPSMGSALLTDSNQGGIRKDLPVFIDRIGYSGGFRYHALSGAEHKPVLFVSFLSAMRFANWLHHGGGSGGTETGAYDLARHGGMAVHEPDARVWIATEDEWYKAAYYQPEELGGPPGGYWLYPVRTNDKPRQGGVGDLSPDAANYGRAYADFKPVGSFPNAWSFYGTFDQGGNAWEWVEASVFGNHRGIRGGCMAHTFEKLRSTVRNHASPGRSYPDTGFRLARAVPVGETAAAKQP